MKGKAKRVLPHSQHARHGLVSFKGKKVRATHNRRPGPPNSFTDNKKHGGGDEVVSTIVSYSSSASGHANQHEHTKTEGELAPARGIVV